MGKLREVSATVPAINVYCGRAMNEAFQASRTVNAGLMILSAGLGLVDGQQLIPRYNLTVTGVSDANIIRHCGPSNSLAQDWWRELNTAKGERNSIKSIFQNPMTCAVVLAISNSYLKMIEGDLAELNEIEKKKLRIVTHSNPELEKGFGRNLMPYSSRFDGPESPNPGTKADFAQRAAHHFCGQILARFPDKSAEQHWREVEAQVATLPNQRKFERKRMDDDQIVELIRRFWDDSQGQSGRMLRLLRDREQVACEQGRFKNLFNQIEAEMEEASGRI